MKPPPIRTEHDYQQALLTIDSLLCTCCRAQEADELLALTTQVEKYEDTCMCIREADPREAVRNRLQQLGAADKM